jgi:hypothetical protein
MKASPRIILVGPTFQQQFLNQAQTSSFRAVRESTQTERNTWIAHRIQQGQNMMDCAGESVIPPHVKWVDLLGKLIQVDKVRCKVPFTDANYRPFKNYGRITIYTDLYSAFETYYMPSDEIKTIQSLIKTNFDNHSISF